MFRDSWFLLPRLGRDWVLLSSEPETKMKTWSTQALLKLLLLRLGVYLLLGLVLRLWECEWR